MQSFYESGVRHAVISPGSRSTPITLAAAIHPGIQKKIVLDERSAAFIALGIGKATGIPALLICTSGTAMANYFPAVVEAKESGVPIIIISADRPPYLRNIGSSQTIDQIKLFGNYAVFFHDTGEPKLGHHDLKRIKYLAGQAVDESIKKGGTAHINLPFRKPLEPDKVQLNKEIERLLNVENNHATQNPILRRDLQLNGDINLAMSTSGKPLIIAGPANPHHSLQSLALQFSYHLNAPVIAEPGGGLRGNQNIMMRYEQYLNSEVELKNLKPDLILRFGDQPFTKSVLKALKKWENVFTLHFSGRKSWQDHAMSVDHFVHCQPGDSISLENIESAMNTTWLNSWKEADFAADSIQNETLKNESKLTDAHLFSHLGNQIGKSWHSMLSNSYPVRDMAMFGQPVQNLHVNRGAAGIDGIMSTALGIHFATGKPTCAVVGDLAFFHDSNALYSVKHATSPFIIIVVNNGGGDIFKMLPVYKQGTIDTLHPGLFDTYFKTPQNVNIQSLAEASGINYHKIESLKQLEELQLNQYKYSTVVECVTDSEQSMKIREILWNS